MVVYLFLLGLIGTTIAKGNISDTKSVGEYPVPEIQGCTYENAHSIRCWWNRQQGDSSTQYRLGYLSASDAFHERREKICDMTQQTAAGDVTVESCKFKGSMYGQYTIYVTRVINCDATNTNCESTGPKSKSISFTCTSNNVELTIPPGELEIETTTYLLMWSPPDKDSSMLSFVLNRRHVLYTVEYREIVDGNTDIEWKKLYSGYKTSVFLPTLTAGSMYEVKVSASLDPPRLRPTEERKWTEPSNILVFLVPREITSQHVIEEFQVEATVEQTPDEEPTENVPRRPRYLSRRVVIASAVSSLTIVTFLAVIGFFIPWKRLCCMDGKISKPVVFITLSDDGKDEENDKERFQNQSRENAIVEKAHPITQILSMNASSFKHTSNMHSSTSNRRYTSLFRENNNTVSDYARQRLLSPVKMADGSIGQESQANISQDNLLADVANDVNNARNDVVIEMGHGGWNMSQSKQELRTLLKNCGALDKDMASPELHGCNKEENDENIPSYIMSTGLENDVSYNRSTSEYVIDSTGMDSLLAPGMHDVTSMTSSSQEEKHKQWQKYIMESQYSDDDSDIPDYVMHAPSQSKDFCRNMNIFVSMATEDLNESPRPLDVYREQCESAKLPHTDSKHIIVMTVCSSCKNSIIHETCDNTESVEPKNEFLSITVPPTRRGSVSDNSVDSGYSPDSPDCVTATSRVKDNVLNAQFDMRSSVGGDNDSDNDDYMRYVTS